MSGKRRRRRLTELRRSAKRRKKEPMKSDCRSATGETALEEKGEEGKRGNHCQQQHQRPMNTEEAPRDRRNRGDSVGSINLGNSGRGIPHLLAMMMRSRTVRTTMMESIMKKACSGCHQPRRRKQQHGNGTGYGAELLHVWEANVGRSQSAAKKKMQIICNSGNYRTTRNRMIDSPCWLLIFTAYVPGKRSSVASVLSLSPCGSFLLNCLTIFPISSMMLNVAIPPSER